MEVSNAYHNIRSLEIKIADAKNNIAQTTNENLKVAWNVIIADWEETLTKKKAELVELISSLVNPQK
jgi:hypothetical protein